MPHSDLFPDYHPAINKYYLTTLFDRVRVPGFMVITAEEESFIISALLILSRTPESK